MLILHIGPPKTGTTTLQKRVFPALTSVDYRDWPDETELPALFRYLFCDSLYADEAAAEAARREMRAWKGEETVLLSFEGLLHQRFDRGDMARRLANVVDDLRVIMTVRHQHAWLESSFIWGLRYWQYPWVGGIPQVSFDRWLAAGLGTLWKGRYQGRLPTGDIGRIAELYAGLIGRENVCVLVFEELRQPERFASRLAEFLDCDPAPVKASLEGMHDNPRLGRAELLWWQARALGLPLGLAKLLTGSTHATKPVANRILPAKPAVRYRVPERWKAPLAEFYGPGNRYLVETFGLPLEELGYPLG